MGFKRRIGFIVKSQFNDWVTRAEDPEKIINQAVEEMEEGLEKAKTKIGLLGHRVEEERKLTEKISDQSGYWQKKAEEFITKGMESNAREAIRKRRVLDEEHRVIKLRLEEDILKLSDYEERFSELEERVKTAKQRRGLLIREISLDKESVGTSSPSKSNSPEPEDPFTMFTKMEERVGRETELSVFSMNEEAERVESEKKLIDEEIEVIKNKLSKGGKK